MKKTIICIGMAALAIIFGFILYEAVFKIECGKERLFGIPCVGG